MTQGNYKNKSSGHLNRFQNHYWTLKSLKLVGIEEYISIFIQEATSKCNTTLTLNGKGIGLANIRRESLQGYSLSPFLFVIALIPLTQIFNKTVFDYQLLETSMQINHLLYIDDPKLYGKNQQETEYLFNTEYSSPI